MTPIELAEQKLAGMLAAVELRKKASYYPSHVQAILGISERTFWRMVGEYEPDPSTGEPINPATLDSFMLNRHRRVRHDELVAYMMRNNTYQRTNAPDPRQMEMW